MKRFLFAFVLGIAVVSPTFAFAHGDVTPPLGYVSDFAGILQPTTVQNLNRALTVVDQSGKAQISVVTIPTLLGDTIEDYTVDLFKDWGVGQKGKDNGLMLLIARDEQQARIEVGYGLEGDVTDLESHRILDEVVIPQLKAGKVDDAVNQAVSRLVTDITGQSLADFQASSTSVGAGNPISSCGKVCVGIIIVVFLFLLIKYPRVLVYILLSIGRGNNNSSSGGGFGGFGGGRSGGGGSSS